MKNYITIIAAITMLVGCGYAREMRKFYYGMPAEQAFSIMGQHEGYVKEGEYEIYVYYHKNIYSGGAVADYYFIVKDGKVVEYGAKKPTGELPHKGGGVILFMPPFMPPQK